MSLSPLFSAVTQGWENNSRKEFFALLMVSEGSPHHAGKGVVERKNSRHGDQEAEREKERERECLCLYPGLSSPAYGWCLPMQGGLPLS
jgi:hypothetical protein